MPGDRLSLPVRVGRQIDPVRLLHFLAQLCQDFSLSADRNIFWLIVVLYINSKLTFGQISHMPVGSVYLIAASQEFFNCLHLCGRLHDHKAVRHTTLTSFCYNIDFLFY